MQHFTTTRPDGTDDEPTPVTTTSVILFDVVPDTEPVAARCRGVSEWCGVTKVATADGADRFVSRPLDGVTIEVDVVDVTWSAHGDETAFIKAVAEADVPAKLAARILSHRGFVRIRTTAARMEDMTPAAALGREVTQSVASMPGALAWYSPTLSACIPTAQSMRSTPVSPAA